VRDAVVEYVQGLQDRIFKSLEQFEPSARFKEVVWNRPGGGGGRTRVLAGGSVFEKAGVNTSVVHGELPERMAEKLKTSQREFFATGVSLVIHPVSPQVPTVHANYRYFEQPDRWWFGGGADLTPYVPREDLFKHFHQTLKSASASPDKFQQMKIECDHYFHIAHRGETRGVGGIFFDYLNEDFERNFSELKKLGDAFVPAYVPIVEQTKDLPFTERQKKFQLLRRGRYVEFNLVYDRGTLFGLETKGNIESILMSLPAVANWDFSASFEENEEEMRLMSYLRKPIDWA
jgi:coproporphyrinogen III oxidase